MDNDGINLGIFRKPQLRARAGVCKKCGAPSAGVGNLCVACLNTSFFDEALRQQARAFKEHPGVDLEMAKDQHGLRHAILIGHPAWTFCRVRPTEAKYKRSQVRASERLPVDLCPVCRDLIDRAREGITQ